MESPMERRMRVYPYLAVTAYIISSIYGILKGNRWFIESDFICFYAASKKILAGDLLGIYDIYKFHEFEEQLSGTIVEGFLPYAYPPIFSMFISPLALLPYLTALFIWLSMTLTGYVVVVRKIAPHSCTFGLALAYPGTLLNLLFTQNGFLSAFLMGAGLLLLAKRPIVAGMLLGLLTYKPQLTLLLGVALVAAKMWRALIAACATVIMLVIVSIALYGVESWQAFYNALPFMQNAVNTNISQCQRMQTIFASALLAGMPVTLSYGLQTIFSVGAVILVAWAWRQKNLSMAYVILSSAVFFCNAICSCV